MLKPHSLPSTFWLSPKHIPAFSTKKSGNLYTWGGNPVSLGYYAAKVKDPIYTPQKVETFNNNVTKVVTGPNHTAVITTDGDLYTFGKGTYGKLGHGDKHHYIKPKAVQFFRKNKLKVIDVACAEKMTLAVTEDGDVWSWGSGRKSENLFSKFLPSDSNDLGTGSKNQRFSPAPIEALRKLPHVFAVTAGYRFCFALNVKKNLYYWGKGEHGVFGEGEFKGLQVPRLHEVFQQMNKSHGLKIKKIMAAANYAMVLFNNGTVYSWGENVSGQLGIEDQFNENFIDIVKTPELVTTEELTKQRIVDFDLGEEISVFLTNENKVYWSGLKLSPVPTQLQLPSKAKIKKIGAAGSSIIAVADDNKVYTKNFFLQPEYEDPKTGVGVTDFSNFAKGKIIDIGGTYSNKFAIVQE